MFPEVEVIEAMHIWYEQGVIPLTDWAHNAHSLAV